MLSRLICKIFGHNPTVLMKNDMPNGSTVTAFKCYRCGKQWVEQWDW